MTGSVLIPSAKSIPNSTDLLEEKALSIPQQLLFQEMLSSLEIMESKFKTAQKEAENLANLASDLKAEKTYFSENFEKALKKIQVLELEKNDLLDGINGEITQRTGKVLANQIQSLEFKYEQYEENIELLEDEKNYQKFMLDQIGEINQVLQKEKCELQEKVKKMMQWMKENVEEKREFERNQIMRIEPGDQKCIDQSFVLKMLKMVRVSICEDYVRKSNHSGAKTQVLQEIVNKSRIQRPSSS